MNSNSFNQRLNASAPVTAAPNATVRGWILTTCDSNEFEDLPEGERILIADTPEYANGNRAVVLYPDGIMLGMNVYQNSDSSASFLKSTSFSLEGVAKLMAALNSAKCPRSANSLHYPVVAWLFGGPLPR